MTKKNIIFKYISKKNIIYFLSLLCFILLIIVIVISTDNDSNGNNIIIPTNAPTNSPTSAPTNSPTNSPISAPTSAPTNSPTSAPTEVLTNKPKVYLINRRDYIKPTIATVNWPDTLINPIYVEFRFRYTETPVPNATIIDCQNQSKLYAGWKLYFKNTLNTLVLQIGTMSNGTTANEYVYHYKKLEQNIFYKIVLIFFSNSIIFGVNDSEISMTDFDTSLPVLWDSNIHIGEDNQYPNRSLLEDKFKIDNLYIYL